jgi:hypothetical protein
MISADISHWQFGKVDALHRMTFLIAGIIG